MLHLFNSSFEVVAFWTLAPLVVVGCLYAIVSAIRGWHRHAYVSVERHQALKRHAQELSHEGCYFTEDELQSIGMDDVYPLG